jgi:hypothetical protein
MATTDLYTENIGKDDPVIYYRTGINHEIYDPEYVWTETSGALHMQIRAKSDTWSCAEKFLNRSLGYGTAYSCELNA